MMVAKPPYIMGVAGRDCTPHGEVGCRLHTAWASMKRRCYTPSHDSYPSYGGRGIEVYKPWHVYPVFAKEIRETIGEHPGDGYQLDRIDNNGNYEPGNVRWATNKENMRNRRANTMLTFKGRTQCVSAWAEEMGWGKHVILNRIKLGWTTEEILTTPKGSKAGGWERRRAKSRSSRVQQACS